MTAVRVGIVGGGATAAALLWTLAQSGQEFDVTMIHDQASLGGHSLTPTVTNPNTGKDVAVDVGVQFIAPMMYPNVKVMLDMDPFSTTVPMSDYDSLKIACAFPNAIDGSPQCWGNFPAYQTGTGPFVMWTSDVASQLSQVTEFIQNSLGSAWISKLLSDYFTDTTSELVQYFINPYMSIINGYGNAELNEMTFADIYPLFATIPNFPTPLGGWLQPGTGWQRFTNGAQSWVDGMLSAAVACNNITYNPQTGCQATAVWTTQGDGNPVTVQWQDSSGALTTSTFDKVVLTTDMATNAELLGPTQSPNNQTFWTTYQQSYVEAFVPNLQPGWCYIHTDVDILSPQLRLMQETLQFTAPGTTPYDLSTTYTTYLIQNLMATPQQQQDAEGLFVTMYGYDTVVNPPNNVLYGPVAWTHGMWAATFMVPAKKSLWKAQGQGVLLPDNPPTNVYFAGNNTTQDSEEGALISAMAIANYMFGIPYPLSPDLRHPVYAMFAFGMFLAMYLDVMFPVSASDAHRQALISRLAAG